MDFFHSVFVNPVSGGRDGDGQWHVGTVTGFCCQDLVLVRDEFGRTHIKPPAEVRLHVTQGRGARTERTGRRRAKAAPD